MLHSPSGLCRGKQVLTISYQTIGSLLFPAESISYRRCRLNMGLGVLPKPLNDRSYKIFRFAVTTMSNLSAQRLTNRYNQPTLLLSTQEVEDCHRSSLSRRTTHVSNFCWSVSMHAKPTDSCAFSLHACVIHSFVELRCSRDSTRGRGTRASVRPG